MKAKVIEATNATGQLVVVGSNIPIEQALNDFGREQKKITHIFQSESVTGSGAREIHITITLIYE